MRQNPTYLSRQESITETTRPAPDDRTTKRREILTFLGLAFVVWPFVAVAIVGGYGFLVWMSQMIMGPPGPPPV